MTLTDRDLRERQAFNAHTFALTRSSCGYGKPGTQDPRSDLILG